MRARAGVAQVEGFGEQDDCLELFALDKRRGRHRQVGGERDAAVACEVFGGVSRSVASPSGSVTVAVVGSRQRADAVSARMEMSGLVTLEEPRLRRDAGFGGWSTA